MLYSKNITAEWALWRIGVEEDKDAAGNRGQRHVQDVFRELLFEGLEAERAPGLLYIVSGQIVHERLSLYFRLHFGVRKPKPGSMGFEEAFRLVDELLRPSGRQGKQDLTQKDGEVADRKSVV